MQRMNQPNQMADMKVIAIIPARMGSSRFPNKPIKKILGLSMIEHVRRRVEMSSVFSDVIVATCDSEILEEVQRFGGKAVMTAATHERCTDRIAEAAENYDADIIVNVQGDEPLVRPEMFDDLVRPLEEDEELQCTNLMVEIKKDDEYQSENVVKTVFDLNRNAIYFSRAAIPSSIQAKGLEVKKYKQLGLIAFRRGFLFEYTNMPQTPLEIIESVDMMRIVEHGIKVRMVESEFEVIGVDTPYDLEVATELMKSDPLFPKYYRQ